MTPKFTLLLFLLIVTHSFAQIGIGTTTPSAALEVSATDEGLLIPRIALTATNSASPLITPSLSELVFNTATAGTTPNSVTPGYYYWDGSGWIRLATGTINGWAVTGNSGTNPATNYIGTSDANDLVFRTNNTERMRINNAVGSTTGTVGDISIGNTTSGTIKSNRELVLRQDGDTFGSSVLRLRNRNAENGAIFENLNPTPAGTNLVDFIFRTGTTAAPITSNIRFETRSGSRKVTGNTTEWQFGQPDNLNGGPTLVIGANGTSGTGSNSAFLIGNVGIGNSNPQARLHNNGTTALTTATSGTSNTILLLDGGTFSTPAASVANGMVYIIRNTSTTTDTTVNSIINYNSSVAANFTLTPTIGSIMIVSNGTNWYRID